MTEIESHLAVLERRLARQREDLSALTARLGSAYDKIGKARAIVERYWEKTPAGSVGLVDGTNAWNMHVALVQLAKVLKR